jgi:hypothetical protein
VSALNPPALEDIRIDGYHCLCTRWLTPKHRKYENGGADTGWITSVWAGQGSVKIQAVVGPAYALSTTDGVGTQLRMHGNDAICWLSIAAYASAAVGDSEFRIDFGQGGNVAMYSIPLRGRSNEAATNELSRSAKVSMAAGVYDARLWVPSGWSFDANHYVELSCLEIDSAYAHVTAVYDQYQLPSQSGTSSLATVTDSSGSLTTHDQSYFPSVQCFVAFSATASGTTTATNKVVIDGVAYDLRTTHSTAVRPLSWQTMINYVPVTDNTVVVDLQIITPVVVSSSDYLYMTCIEMHKSAGRVSMGTGATKQGGVPPGASQYPWQWSNQFLGHYRNPMVCPYAHTATAPATGLPRTTWNDLRIPDMAIAAFYSDFLGNVGPKFVQHLMPMRVSRSGRSTHSGHFVLDGATSMSDYDSQTIYWGHPYAPHKVAGFTYDITADFASMLCLEVPRAATNGWTYLTGTAAASAAVISSTKVEDSAISPGGRLDVLIAVHRSTDHIHIYGGKISLTQQTDHWRFNPTTGKWMQILGTYTWTTGMRGALGEELPTVKPGPRSATSAMVSTANYMWLFGGGPGNGGGNDYANDLHRFNFNTLNWAWIGGTTMPDGTPNNRGYGTNPANKGQYLAQNWPSGRSWPAMTASNDGTWLAIHGGYQYAKNYGNGYNDGKKDVSATLGSDLWVYRIDLGQWAWLSGPLVGTLALNFPPVQGMNSGTGYSAMPQARARHSITVDVNDDIWLYQGASRANDMW